MKKDSVAALLGMGNTQLATQERSMEMKVKTLATALAGMAMAAFANLAGANLCTTTADLNFTLDTANLGSGYTGPYVQVCIDVTSATTANVEFVSLTNGGYTYLMSDGSSAALNVNATGTFTVSGITFTQPSGFTTAAFTVENPPGTSNVNGFGSFNLVLDNVNGFPTAVNDLSFTVTDATATWLTNGSNFLTANSQNAVAASHVFATSNFTSAANTGYAAGSNGTFPPQEIPEPGMLTLLGAGLLGFGAVRLRKK